MMYEYDFGDFWEHEIRVEAREQPSADKPWPVCTDGARAGPPEDIGGPGGYERLLERLDELRFDQGNGLDDFLDENDTSDGEEDDGEDRKRVVVGKSVSVRVALGGQRIIKKKKNKSA